MLISKLESNRFFEIKIGEVDVGYHIKVFLKKKIIFSVVKRLEGKFYKIKIPFNETPVEFSVNVSYPGFLTWQSKHYIYNGSGFIIYFYKCPDPLLSEYRL